jgi:polysaccharide export outer membrane protein
MIVMRLRFLLLAGGALASTACQQGLNPVVPAGAAAYTVIGEGGRTPSAGYALSSGDVVSVSVFQEPELSHEAMTIDAAGNLDLLLLGQVRAEGLTTSELAQNIERAYATRYLRNPRVSVTLNSAVQQHISVEGEVGLPGIYTYRKDDTLLSALAEARSPLSTAKLDQVLIFRTRNGQRLGGRFDVKAIREGRMEDPVLVPGDIVVVGFSQLRGAFRDFLQLAPAIGSFVYISGL